MRLMPTESLFIQFIEFCHINGLLSYTNFFTTRIEVFWNSKKVALTQVRQTDRLTLASPTKQILTYYDTKTLANIVVVSSRESFLLAVLFASKSTAFNWYRATPVSKANGVEDGCASQYDLKLNYIAIDESTSRIELPQKPQIDNCVGSSSFFMRKWFIIVNRRKNVSWFPISWKPVLSIADL